MNCAAGWQLLAGRSWPGPEELGPLCLSQPGLTRLAFYLFKSSIYFYGSPLIFLAKIYDGVQTSFPDLHIQLESGGNRTFRLIHPRYELFGSVRLTLYRKSRPPRAARKMHANMALARRYSLVTRRFYACHFLNGLLWKFEAYASVDHGRSDCRARLYTFSFN